jgi:hypothetical protein
MHRYDLTKHVPIPLPRVNLSRFPPSLPPAKESVNIRSAARLAGAVAERRTPPRASTTSGGTHSRVTCWSTLSPEAAVELMNALGGVLLLFPQTVRSLAQLGDRPNPTELTRALDAVLSIPFGRRLTARTCRSATKPSAPAVMLGAASKIAGCDHGSAFV